MREYLVRMQLEGLNLDMGIVAVLHQTLEMMYDSKLKYGKKNGNLYFYKEIEEVPPMNLQGDDHE